MYASPTVRRQYSERHDGHYPQAQPNDIAFAVHALVFSLITLASIFVYKVRRSSSHVPTWLCPLWLTTVSPRARAQRDPKQRLSTFNRGVLAFLLSTIGIGALLVATDKVAALDLVLWLSYVKLYISTTKMVPQAWINFRRKSTVGWSIENILLDFTGGVLSLCVGRRGTCRRPFVPMPRRADPSSSASPPTCVRAARSSCSTRGSTATCTVLSATRASCASRPPADHFPPAETAHPVSRSLPLTRTFASPAQRLGPPRARVRPALHAAALCAVSGRAAGR